MTARPFFIISVDGGGCRGVFPALLLQALGDAVVSRADLLAGTSTGAILAGGLAAGVPVDRLAAVYSSQAANATIFSPHRWAWIPLLGPLLFPRYSAEGLRRVVEGFPETARRLDQMARHCYLPSFLIGGGGRVPQWRATAFHNLGDGAGLGGFAESSLLDAIMASAAAPTYFPPHTVDGHTFVDGGVAANNPAISALTAARRAGIIGDPGSPLSRVFLLSLGTGRSESGYPPRPANAWLPSGGIAGWMWPTARGIDTPPFPVMDASWDGVAQLDDYRVQGILGEPRYRRAQLDLGTTPYPLDDYRRLEGPDGLIALTKRYLASDTWREIAAWVRGVVGETTAAGGAPPDGPSG